MFPVLFKIGVLPIHAYGFMVGMAFLVATSISLFFAKKEKIKAEVILEAAILIIFASIIGSRLLFVFNNWFYFKNHLNEIFMVQSGGLTFLGGLILAVLILTIFTKVREIPVLKLLDILAPGISLGYAMARIGCFLSGCCFGLPTKVPWAVHFPPGSPAYYCFSDKKIHPTQLYSFGSMIMVFIIIVFLYRKKKYDGHIFWWWMVLYAFYRFPVEFLRHSPIYWWRLTPSQWIVLVLALLASSVLLYKKFRSKI